jgi:hypothetical protein
MIDGRILPRSALKPVPTGTAAQHVSNRELLTVQTHTAYNALQYAASRSMRPKRKVISLLVLTARLPDD